MADEVQPRPANRQLGGRLCAIGQRLTALRQRQQELCASATDAPFRRRLAFYQHELSSAHNQLLREIASLCEAVEALEDRYATLVAEREAADHADRGMARLLAAASHDLLQPLGATRLFLSALKGTRLRPQNRDLVERADRALTSAQLLLGSLLEISEMDARGVRPEITNFPISSLLATLANEFEPIAAQKGLTLTVMLSTTRVLSDISMLRRVLQNLISNAINYTETGKVLVGCRRRADGLRVEVWDTGRGVAPGELDRIFEEFYRIEPARDSETGRVGLGLSIVRRMARTLNHDISVRSQPGRGSCFAVTVPYGRAMPALRPDDIAPQPRLGPLRDALVVVVENDHDMLQAMTAQLVRWSCRVVAARSTCEALDKLKPSKRRPGLLIVDHHLGQSQTGLEFIRQVRAEQDARLPAILITADRSCDLKEAAHRARCGFLTKPFGAAELHALIASTFADEAVSG